MKRIICLITTLCLILGSFSFCFAAGWSDSQISSVVSDLSTVKTTLNNIYSRLGTIMNYLTDSNHSVAYWTSAIASWMQPIYTQLTSGLVSETDILPIISGLNKVVTDGTNTTYYPYLLYNGTSNAELTWKIADSFGVGAMSQQRLNIDSNGKVSFTNQSVDKYSRLVSWGLNDLKSLSAQIINNDFDHRDKGYNATQSILSWSDLSSTYTFTPQSATDGIYKYLNALNTPIARLSYVLASDERIEAQEAAAANEEAVVDNFIDSSGDGSASTSDIGSISDLSSGYKSNFGSDAQVTGIFNIFNSNNMGWFSQETANQLDTTTPTRRGSSFETPLLDQQIEDIYDQIGIKND